MIPFILWITVTPHWVTENNDYYTLVEHYVTSSGRFCGSVTQREAGEPYEAEAPGIENSKWEIKSGAEREVARACDRAYPGNEKNG